MDETRPAVSVITIFLNEEQFLAQAIESVLAQSDPQWELLLCDDGSTDGSSALARKYAAEHPGRIRYFEHAGHENRGMSATRNLGLAHARADLIAFLDADDVWLPDKLARQRAALEMNPSAAMAYGPTTYWHSWTGAAEDAAGDAVSRLPVAPGRVTRGSTILARIVRGRGHPLATCSILARRAAIAAVGGFENRFTSLFEDQAFFAKFLLDHDVYVMSECLDLYRQHPASSCAVATRDQESLRQYRVAFLTWLLDYMDEHHADSLLRSSVRRELWLQRHSALVFARWYTRQTAELVYVGTMRFAFALSRVVLPSSLRQWLWRTFSSSNDARRATAHVAGREGSSHPGFLK